jgi:hypothetical protein
MAGWVLVPCGEQLRAEVNALAPNRDKGSDGTIGDTAHQRSTSSHNDDEIGKVPIRDADSKHEVHAWDADRDLREPGLTMEMIVQFLLARCRSGAERRLRYIIFNYRIWSASNGWKQQAYSGSNPHDHHAHFDFSYETAREADRSSWRLEDIPVALTQSDKDWLADRIDRAATAAAQRVWDTERDINRVQGKPPYMAKLGNVLAGVPHEHGSQSSAIADVRTALNSDTA